ncbi:outer membrane lipoprotein [Zoogloea dura]|jgi:outer membrane lipoprotein SlyB|uniref:Glycine zipper 2TM domain-containing protein n=1 Tax=Zoogloea dura TaxID=2728840 RepID=A0A848G8P0_9RHOO|nr:glycine zipper 2TM domain-containing protein [Zoogloea dura]NML25941.1 glycine zipper 2TM domain-containing protein [Zoogloea dura]
MSTTPARPGLHPMLWVAAASVTAVSLAGVAKIAGVLPDFGSNQPATEAIATTPGVPAIPADPVPPPALAAAEPPASAVAAPAEPTATRPAKAEHRESAPKAASKPHARSTPANPPSQPAAAAIPNDAVPAPPPPGSPDARRVTEAPPPICRDCGVIEHVEAVQQKGEGTGIGAVGGAILGGVLGHQVGEGSGKQLARIGGAVLGGFAGNEAERRVRTVSHYRVTVRMEDGTRRVIEQQSEPAWRNGDAVRIRNGEIVAGGGSRPAQGSRDF